MRLDTSDNDDASLRFSSPFTVHSWGVDASVSVCTYVRVCKVGDFDCVKSRWMYVPKLRMRQK